MIFEETFQEAQTDNSIVTPATGKKLVVFVAFLKGTGSLKFNGEILLEIENGEGSVNGWIEGEVDKSVILNCNADTTVKVSYDEH